MPEDYKTMIFQTLADANRKLGQIKGDESYTKYADFLENQITVHQAEQLIEEK